MDNFSSGTFRRVSPLFVMFVSLALLCAPAAAHDFPPGFITENVLDFFSGPLSIQFEDDGMMWLSQSGPGEGMKIWYLLPGTTTPVMAYDFGTFPSGERGVHSIRLDPDFANNNQMWVYYTVNGPPAFNRLSRFTVTGTTISNEVVVLDGPTLNTEAHNGGCLEFAQDGTLLLGMGDDASGNAAKDPFQLKGKILRMTTAGTAPPDNPFADGTAGDPLVWAVGLRNPFRCELQPGLDNLFVSDVGWDTWEEISIAVAGANLGWPFCEGPASTDQVTPGPCVGDYLLPLHAYNHNGMSAAVIGGVHIRPGEFAPQYEGDYFFADWFSGEIFRIELDASNNVLSVEEFGHIDAGGRIVDFEIGPDGAMYVSARGTVQNVIRISWAGGDNGQPEADVAVLPDSAGPAPLMVTLDGSGSSDPDEDPLTFDWDLGDATNASTTTVNKTYPQGFYDVQLTVDDGEFDDRSPTVRIVSGNTRPAASVTAPSAALTYDAGDTIAFSGTIGDSEDPLISGDCNQYTWQVTFHHLDHTHPFYGPTSGSCGGSFTVPLQGETSPFTYFTVRLLGEDLGTPIGPGGVLSGESIVEVHPNLSVVTLETDPPGLQIAFDAQPQSSGAMITGVVNMTRSLDALDGQTSAGQTFQFVSWSDSGAAQHDISFPSVDTTYTALYQCGPIGEVVGLRVEPAGSDLTLSWDPVPSACLSSGPQPYRVYAAPTSTPTVGSGSFPLDPAFRVVGTSSTTSLTFTPLASDAVFLVVAEDTNDLEGPAGHYEP